VTILPSDLLEFDLNTSSFPGQKDPLSVLSVSAGLSRNGGGTSYAIPALHDALAEVGVQTTLVTPLGREGGPPSEGFKFELKGFPQAGLGPWELPWAPALRENLKALCLDKGFDLVHNHGAWLPANHDASRFAAERDLPLVLSSHGMLSKWCLNHNNLRKKLAWGLFQRKDLLTARAAHASSAREAKELRELGYNGPIALIPNGVEIPEWREPARPQGQPRTALFLSRVHPQKGLPSLVEAWDRVRPRNWRMVVAGPDDGGHRAKLEELVEQKKLSDLFTFLGPVHGQAKWDLYRSADLFILPTVYESFGLVVAEALASGVPVITTHGAPWADLNIKNCGWWIPNGVEALTHTLGDATQASDNTRRAMGRRGRDLVIQKFSWRNTALDMKALYQWVTDEAECPPFVRMD